MGDISKWINLCNISVNRSIFGKSQISHWLNKDIETIKSNFQKELEDLKSKNLIELEAYKASLVSETENKKAYQAIQTSVALKFSENQFHVVNAINLAYADMGNMVVTLYQGYQDENVVNEKWRKMLNLKLAEFQKRSDALTEAIFSASLFMSEAEVEKLHNYSALLSGVVELSINTGLRKIGVQKPPCLVKSQQIFREM